MKGGSLLQVWLTHLGMVGYHEMFENPPVMVCDISAIRVALENALQESDVVLTSSTAIPNHFVDGLPKDLHESCMLLLSHDFGAFVK
jgi:hypothetical protein